MLFTQKSTQIHKMTCINRPKIFISDVTGYNAEYTDKKFLSHVLQFFKL